MRHTRPVAPVFPCDPTALLQSQQPSVLHRFYPFEQPLGWVDYHLHLFRNIGSFPPRVRFRVAQYQANCGSMNGVEGGIASPSAPLRPHQLNYEHAATADSVSGV